MLVNVRRLKGQWRCEFLLAGTRFSSRLFGASVSVVVLFSSKVKENMIPYSG